MFRYEQRGKKKEEFKVGEGVNQNNRIRERGKRDSSVI